MNITGTSPFLSVADSEIYEKGITAIERGSSLLFKEKARKETPKCPECGHSIEDPCFTRCSSCRGHIQ